MKLNKTAGTLTAACMLFSSIGANTYVEADAAPTVTLTVTADKQSALTGETVTYTLLYACTGNTVGADFNLDIPEGLEFVTGSFSFESSGTASLGFTSTVFSESGEGDSLPYSVMLSGGSKADSEAVKIAEFKCKVSDSADGVYSIGTVDNHCIYSEGSAYAIGGWETKAANVYVGVSPYDPPAPPIGPGENTEDYSGKIAYANSSLLKQVWADVSLKTGENTITVNAPQEGGADNVGLLVIDLKDCAMKIGRVDITGIYADGSAVSFDSSKVIYGANSEDLEANDFRIEIYNTFGRTANNSPIDAANLSFNSSLTITLNISEDNTVTACGSAANSLLNDGITVSFKNKATGTEYEAKAEGNDFSADVPKGQYAVTIKKGDYLTRTLDVTVTGQQPAALQNVYMGTLGDIDLDGAITYMDISLLLSFISNELDLSPYQIKAANLTRDTQIDITDATTLIAAANNEIHLS